MHACSVVGSPSFTGGYAALKDIVVLPEGEDHLIDEDATLLVFLRLEAPVIGKPLLDDPVVLDLARLGPVRAKVEVPPVNGHHSLPGGLVEPVGGVSG